MRYFNSGFLSDLKNRASSAMPTEIGEGTGVSDHGESEESAGGAWSFGNREFFGSLVKNLGKKSEEILKTYKQDLSEFADGLKSESEIVAGLAERVLETSAVVAQESIESVGQSLEEFGGSLFRGTAELIAAAKEVVQKGDEEEVASTAERAGMSTHNSWKYSRFESQVIAMQRDSSTYCDEPEDVEEYTAWRSTFDLIEKKPDIEALVKENPLLQELEARIVPLVVDYDNFWARYFYRLHKLELVEAVRANLVKRATTEDEELSWDVEEDAEEEIRPDLNDNQDVPQRQSVNYDSESGNEFRAQEISAESSEASSPTAARRSKQGDIRTENHGSGSGSDEETVSGGSSGSGWLVIKEDNQGVVDSPSKKASSHENSEEIVPAVSHTHAVNAELPKLPELTELEETGADNSSVRKAPEEEESEISAEKTSAKAKGVVEETEEWPDWE